MKIAFFKSILLCFLSGLVLADTAIDNATLQRYLENNFNADESMKWDEIENFMNRFSVTDNQLYDVLMEIYHNAVNQQTIEASKCRESRNNSRLVEGTLTWLAKCENTPVRTFLLDYAASNGNDSANRNIAVLSCLRIAGAEEAKAVLLRFLVEDDRMDGMARLGLYSHAQTVYSESSREKKAAILAALLAAAQKEDGKIEFMKVDKILSERSPMYHQSQERLRLLEQHSKEPPTTNLYTDRDLKAALEASRSYSGYTILGTNLVALMLLDSPQLHQTVPNPVLVQKEMKRKAAKRMSLMIGFIVVAGLAAAAGVWFYRKRRVV